MTPRTKRKPFRSITPALACLALLHIAVAARAQPVVARATPLPLQPLTGECRGTTATRLIVKGQSGKFVVPVHATLWTSLKVPGGIDDVKHPPRIPGFVIKPITDHRTWLWVRPDTPRGKTASLRVWTTSRATGMPYTVTLVLEVAEHARDAPDVAEIVHESEVEAAARAEAQSQAEAEQQRTAAITEAHDQGRVEGIALGRVEGQARAEHAMLAAAARAMNDDERDLVPDTRRMIESGRGLGARYVRARVLSEQYTLITLEVENLDPANQPFRLAEALVFTQQNQRRESHVILPDAPTAIYGGDRVSITVAVEMQPSDQLSDIRVALKDEEGGGPVFPFEGTWYARSKEETERERRAKQSILSVRGVYGAIWIADGEGNGDLDATSISGLGVRFTKGINAMFAFEAEVLGARTGEARFDDVMVETMQGNLRRSATLGRVQLGGVLRFGDAIIPVARVGLGVQGASFAAEMTADGGNPAELDSSFEFNGFVTFGGGVDVRIGDQLLAGIAAAAELPLGSGGEDLFRRSINLGAHLGYGW